MATFHPRCFSNLDVLRTIDPARLVQFLRPYAEFLSARGLPLPSPTDSPADISLGSRDYQTLIEIFMTPDDPRATAPQELVDAIYIINELATTRGMDDLLRAAQSDGVVLDSDGDVCPVDLAIQAWLADPNLVQRVHAEQHLRQPRSFEYFPRTDLQLELPKLKPIGAAMRHSIESAIDDWLAEHMRGRGSKLFVFPRTDAISFMVRHGEPLRREGSMDVRGKTSSVLYRPERFDIIVFDRTLGELRMNAGTRGEKDLYRSVLGAHLFGGAGCFAPGEKYTLDPIRTDGRQCLCCDDVDGIDWIKLSEVQYLWGGVQREIEIRKAKDVYAAYEARGRTMPSAPKIVVARFEVKFSDSSTTRKVTISVPNKTQCQRDDDGALIDTWLVARGFIANASIGAITAPQALPVLAGP